MNVNVSPPRKGFLVIPHEKIRCLTVHDVDFVLDSSLSSVKRPKEFTVLNSSSREFDVHFEAGWKKNVLAKTRRAKTKVVECSLLTDEGRCNCGIYQSRKEKRVRFLTDENGDILPQHITLKNHDVLIQQDLSFVSSWLSKAELIDMKKKAKQFCGPFLSKRPEYRSAVIRMLIRCGAQMTVENSGIEYLLDDTESEEDEDLSTIVDGIHRGLEKRLISALNLPFHIHKRSLSVVLDLQSRLRAIDPSSFTSDQKARLIATQYAVNAQYAKEWARKIAQGDSSSVARNFLYDW